MLITIRNNGIGDVGRKALYEFARSSGATYTKSLRAVADNSTKVAAHGNRLQQEYQTITKILDDLNLMPHNSPDEIVALVMKIASTYVADQIEATVIMAEIEQACRLAGAKTLISLLGALQATDDRIEQNLVKDKVNILTMHSAKGLTAEAVIVACAEDEYIPGKNDNSIEDERRLLYVSLTRAKHYLFMTYCNERTDQQRHSGRTAGSKARTPTRFLRNAPLTVQDGTTFIARM